MTRFDATTPTDRRKLFVEGIRAHRDRPGPFVTFEARRVDGDDGEDEDPMEADPGVPDDVRDGPLDADAAGGGEGDGGGAGGEGDDSAGDEFAWVQFADGVVNLDCADAELDRLKDLLGEYPAFRIDEINRPEDAPGTNVRISVRADAGRIAGFVDEVFTSVYGYPGEYRAWVTEI